MPGFKDQGLPKQNRLCVRRLGFFWFEICEKFNLKAQPFHL